MGSERSGNGPRNEAERRRYILQLREAVRERREELVVAAVLRGHRDVEGVSWATGLATVLVRRAMRDLTRRHRADSLEEAVRRLVDSRLRE